VFHTGIPICGRRAGAKIKLRWTRSDSAAVRRHEEDRMKPENVSARRMVTSLIWLQDEHQITPWKSKRAASHDG
jgi:predicted secreted Zn-dependent protease